LLARGRQIEVEHLPPAEPAASQPALGDELQAAVRNWTARQLASRAAEGNLYQEFLARVEPSLFDVILEQTTGNRAAAADLLGIHRATLRKKLATGDDS
jgi:two-component system nitrogen regulation response regulator GlnG